jgi:hypothetical protein
MVPDRSGLETRSVTIAAGEVQLAGDLTLPEDPKAIVLFAHGSGSSRHSRRNQFVARQLAKSGLATLLFDLLTPEEEQRDRSTGKLRFDVPLLAHRLVRATEFVRSHDSNASYGLQPSSTRVAASTLCTTVSTGVTSCGKRGSASGATEVPRASIA